MSNKYSEEEKRQKAKEYFLQLKRESTKLVDKIGVHLSHCFDNDPDCFGGYECCKYGDEFCPADPKYKNVINTIDGEQQ